MIRPAAAALALAAAAGAAEKENVPFSLRQCLEMAEREAPALRAALARTGEAVAGAQASRAAVLPSLSLQLGVSRAFSGETERLITSVVDFNLATKKPVYAQELQRVPGKDRNDYSLGAHLSQPIWDGGRSWALIRRSDAVAQAAEEARQDERLGVRLAVVRAFYELARAQAQLGVLEETVEYGAQHLSRAEALFDAGRGSRAEIAGARVSLGADRIRLARQQAAVELARADLNVAMGRPPAAPLAIAAVALDAATEIGSAPAIRRGELARLRAEVQVAREDLTAVEGGFWPTVGATASYDRYNNDAARWVGKLDQDWDARIGLGVRYDLYSGGKTTAEERAARERIRGAEEALRAAELQVAGDVERALASARALLEVLAQAGANVAAAEEGLILADERYKAGAGTELEVRDAALKRTEARLVHLFAQYDLLIAQAELRRAAGEDPAP